MKWAGVLLSTWAVASMPVALAQTGKYPERAIRLISPFPPGGTVDVNARILAPAVSKSIGQQVVVDNRSGASGIIGTTEAARAKPDGYSLLINTTPMVTNTLMYGKVPYDVLKDFEPISLLSSTPSFLGVHPSVPARSVRELLKIAKSRPGALDYASQQILQRQNLTFIFTEVQDIDGDTPTSRQMVDIASSAAERGGTIALITTSSVWSRLQRQGMTLTLDPPNEDEMRTIISENLDQYRGSMTIEWGDAELQEAAAILAVAGLAMAGGKPKWMKFDQAKGMAGANGMPVAVYAVVTEEGGGC